VTLIVHFKQSRSWNTAHTRRLSSDSRCCRAHTYTLTITISGQQGYCQVRQQYPCLQEPCLPNSLSVNVRKTCWNSSSDFIRAFHSLCLRLVSKLSGLLWYNGKRIRISRQRIIFLSFFMSAKLPEASRSKSSSKTSICHHFLY
jgi:hypothetical protein